MSKKLILFATESEAKATIHALQATALPDRWVDIYSEGMRPAYYQFAQGWIVLTNIGLFASYHALVQALSLFGQEIDEIINAGFCAALGEKSAIGEIHTVGTVGKLTLFPTEFDALSRDFYEKTTPVHRLSSTGKSLLSADYPIHNEALKKQIQKEWDLVDMEGYALCYAAKALNKAITLYKITSDFAMKGGRSLLQKHKATLSEQLATHLTVTLTTISGSGCE